MLCSALLIMFVCFYFLFLMVIVLYDLLRITASDYPLVSSNFSFEYILV